MSRSLHRTVRYTSESKQHVDVRNAIRRSLFFTKRVLRDHPHKFRVSLDILGVCPFVWVGTAMRYACDVVANLDVVGDVLAHFDDNTREVTAKHASRLSKLKLDVCDTNQTSIVAGNDRTHVSSRWDSEQSRHF